MGHIDWLNERKKGIGGSDAAAILGLNPYMTNVQLWEIKTGRREQEDISNKEVVKFGVAAEDPIRQLFVLDHPEYEITSEPYKTYQNKEHYFIRGSFDGIITDKESLKKGVWECKTTTIRRAADWEKWGGRDFLENRIPQNYYIQVLHYFLTRKDFEFAILTARLTELRYNNTEDIKLNRIHIREYPILRENCISELEYLFDKECEFWSYVERDERPPLVIQGL